MSYEVRYTTAAREDLVRLIDYLSDVNLAAGKRAQKTILRAVTILESFPFTCRKAIVDNPFLRELVIPFGETGYVALYEIRGSRVDILALRHQREDDYLD